VFAVAKAALDGGKGAATGAGRIDTRGPIAIQASWRAEGPFQAGPVQITGKAAGKAVIAGTLGAPRADLDADVAAIDVPRLPLRAAHVRLSFAKGPQGFDGQILVNADSAYGPARARSAFRFVPRGVDLTGLDADAGGVKAAGALSLRGGAPSSADLKLDVGPGAILSEGRLAGTVRILDAGAPTAAIDLAASEAMVRGSGAVIHTGKLTASGPLSRLPYQLTVHALTPQGPLNFDGSGLYEQSGRVARIALNASGGFRKVAFRTLEPIAITSSGSERTTRARLEIGGGRMDVDTRQAEGGITATGALRGVDLKAVNEDFTGRFDADFSLQGVGARLDGSMNARLDGARDVDAPAEAAINGVVKATLRGDELSIDAEASGAKGTTSSLSVQLPAAASAAPLRLAIIRNRPIKGRFAADGEVAPLWDLLFGGDRELAGQAHLAGTLGGTINDPQIAGEATIANGRFRDISMGLVLDHAALTADLKGDIVTISGFSAKDDKGGAVSGSGSVSLLRGGGSNLKLDLDRFRLLDNETAEAQASGPVTINRAANGKVTLSGDLQIDRAQINAEARLRPSVVTMEVIERNRPERFDVQLQPAKTRGPSITLDVRAHAPGRVFVKGRGIDAELSVDAHVTGTMAQPHLEGVARIVQGSYDFAGKRFEFDERGSILLADSSDRMRLDLSASWQGPTVTATIQIRGTAAKPEISLTSSPGLPQDEIMSQVLFGTSASQLSGAQTAELASTATALATGGGFDVLGSLRQFARLDRLAFGGDQTTGMTVAGGKYIRDNVYLEVIGGGRQGPSAEVDWRIKRGFSLVSQIGGEFGAKLAVRWTRDFGESRRRPGAPAPAATTPNGAPP
jgi:translocation and assembly module TamB